MLRFVAGRAVNAARGVMVPRVAAVGMQITRSSHGKEETDEEFDARYEAFFNRPDIDNWEIRKAMNDLAGMCHNYHSFSLYSFQKRLFHNN